MSNPIDQPSKVETDLLVDPSVLAAEDEKVLTCMVCSYILFLGCWDGCARRLTLAATHLCMAEKPVSPVCLRLANEI